MARHIDHRGRYHGLDLAVVQEAMMLVPDLEPRRHRRILVLNPEKQDIQVYTAETM
jgi:hypothetical protein